MPEDMLQATITGDPDGERVTIAVAGQLDLASIDLLRDAVDQVVRTGTELLVFDLSGLTFMDSTGIGLLAVTHNEVLARSGKVAVEGANDLILRLLEISGLADQLEVR